MGAGLCCNRDAWARLARGDTFGAQQAVSWITSSPGPSASIGGAIALASGRTQEGVSTLAWALGAPDSIAWRAFVAPASIMRVAIGEAGPSLHAFNDVAHLSDLG